MSKILIIEDSRVDQAVFASVLTRHLPYCRLFFAKDAYQAREIIAYEAPQAVVLDIDLPRMSGEQFLIHLMKNYPLPVIVASRSVGTTGHRARRLRALGALAVIDKPSCKPEIPVFAQQLCRTLCDSIGICPIPRFDSEDPDQVGLADQPALSVHCGQVPTLIAIGASTGGPPAIESILQHLNSDCPPVIIAQHISSSFVLDFAKRLNQHSSTRAVIAQSGQYIRKGHIYIAPPEKQVRIAPNRMLLVEETTPAQVHAPSVNFLFNSLVEVQPSSTVAILLTGMGDDGASGLLRLRRMGATTIAQNESSSAVYGMPRAAVELKAAKYVLHLSAIGPALRKWTTFQPKHGMTKPTMLNFPLQTLGDPRGNLL